MHREREISGAHMISRVAESRSMSFWKRGSVDASRTMMPLFS
jgi:hypothetical protein